MAEESEGIVPPTISLNGYLRESSRRVSFCYRLVGKRFRIYMREPEIRRSAIEDSKETRSKTHRAARLTKNEYEMLAAFRFHVRQYVHFSDWATEGAGLTPRQYQALLAIKGFPNRQEITIDELAEQLQIAHHSAVGLVDRLMEQKLILRKQCVGDRRHVYVELTERGAKILEGLVGAHRREIRRLGPRLEIALESLILDPIQ